MTTHRKQREDPTLKLALSERRRGSAQAEMAGPPARQIHTCQRSPPLRRQNDAKGSAVAPRDGLISQRLPLLFGKTIRHAEWYQMTNTN